MLKYFEFLPRKLIFQIRKELRKEINCNRKGNLYLVDRKESSVRLDKVAFSAKVQWIDIPALLQGEFESGHISENAIGNNTHYRMRVNFVADRRVMKGMPKWKMVPKLVRLKQFQIKEIIMQFSKQVLVKEVRIENIRISSKLQNLDICDSEQVIMP